MTWARVLQRGMACLLWTLSPETYRGLAPFIYAHITPMVAMTLIAIPSRFWMENGSGRYSGYAIVAPHRPITHRDVRRVFCICSFENCSVMTSEWISP